MPNSPDARGAVIRILGHEETREHGAALALRDLLLRQWPQVADAPGHDVRIVAGAKCHGQRRRDIDVLLLATFNPRLAFAPYMKTRTGPDRWQLVPTIEVGGLCLAIEVKDHDADGVRFVGTAVEVRYRDGWKNASEQNEQQVYSVKGYLETQALQAPRVTPLLWLRNLPNDRLPPRPHPAIASPVTWETVLNVVAQLSPPRWTDGAWVLAPGDDGVLRRAAELFTKEITPTRLDRQRMERITRRTVALEPILQAVGQKLVILRGRGGTGKTIHLLQLAHRLVEEKDARVLILTYNRALVADIRRLLTILGIGDDIVGRTIQMQTVHSFLYDALHGLRILDPAGTDFLSEYERLKDEALEYLRSGAVSREDIEELVARGHEAFAWDYVFVDEAQDWPANERDLLVHLYGPGRVVVADGIDQLVRSTAPVDWRAGLPRSASQVMPLTMSLRMKAGLVRFVSSVARHLGLVSSGWEANEDAPGGKVIVVDGSYFASRALHDRLLRENAGSGNQPVDMLFCVPPSLVTRTPHGDARSVAATAFEQWGLRVWDGAAGDVRESYPTEVDQHRVVQYESCRGLEGWTVANLALDDFYEHKLAIYDSEAAGTRHTDGFGGDGEAARIHAARWTMIPLTRAIDTLVVQVSRPYSAIRAALEAASEECRDYVDWLTVR